MIRQVVSMLGMRIPIALRYDPNRMILHIGSYTSNECLVRSMLTVFGKEEFKYKRTQKNKFKFIANMDWDAFKEGVERIEAAGYTVSSVSNLGTIMR